MKWKKLIDVTNDDIVRGAFFPKLSLLFLSQHTFQTTT